MTEEDSTVTVVLDTNLSDALIEEGFVREIISKIQTMRKEAGKAVKGGIKWPKEPLIRNSSSEV